MILMVSSGQNDSMPHAVVHLPATQGRREGSSASAADSSEMVTGLQNAYIINLFHITENQQIPQ